MHRWVERTKYSVGVLGLVLSSVSGAIWPAMAHASGEAFTGSSSVSGTTAEPVAITDLQISGTGDDSVSVRLYVPSGSLEMGVTSGVTFTGDSSGSTLYFSGTRSNLNAALASLTYAGTIGEVTLEASLTEPGEIYNYENGHMYEVVLDEMDWTSAEAAASARTKYGASGYLATMTSAEENAFVSSRLEDAGWMGASDSESEDDWKWVAGPEDGTSFWFGLADEGGAPIDGNYENWGDGEPNNAGDEDCAQFLSGGSGEWNDLPCTESELPAYVVEYGDEGDLPSVATKNVTITTTGSTRTIDSCTDLTSFDESAWVSDTIELANDIDCEGVPVSQLFADEDYGFEGTFDGNNHTISNLTIYSSESYNVGLFAHARGAEFKDVALSGGSVTGNGNVGALVGAGEDITVSNVSSDLTVISTDSGVGGLIGRLTASEEATVRDSFATGNVTGASDTGGLIGRTSSGGGATLLIERSFATGTVTGMVETSDIGGLVGELEAYTEGGNALAKIQDSYAWGDVTAEGSSNVGGLVGRLDPEHDGGSDTATVVVRRSYASGNVTGSGNVGGLAGENDELYDNAALEIQDTFATGTVIVTEEGTSGAVLGEYNAGDSEATSENNHFDQTGTGLENCSGNGELPGCSAVNTDGNSANYFKNNNINEPLASWDFTSVWVKNAAEYPTFTAIPVEGGGTDDDSDGIGEVEEEAAPNEGDANDDGVVDSEQAYVSSFVNDVTGDYVVLELDDSCSNTAVNTSSEASKPVKDSGFEYPAGLLGFTSECGTPGFTATIVQYYYGIGVNSFAVRKYNPATNAYFTIPGATVSAVTVGGESALKVTYQIVDGGSLDLDGAANGTIVDPAGLALTAVSVPNTGLGGSSR